MPWGKMDDKFHRNPKVRRLRRMKGGMAALGVWAFWWSWCLDDGRLTGVVPLDELESAEDQRSAKLLVEVGLWDAVDGGYRFHDFHEYNPTPAQRAAKKQYDREFAAQQREAKKAAEHVESDTSRVKVVNDSDTSRNRVVQESFPARASRSQPNPTQPNHNSMSPLPSVVAAPDPDFDAEHDLGVRVAVAFRDTSNLRWAGAYSNDPRSFRTVASNLRQSEGVTPEALCEAFWREVRADRPGPAQLAKMAPALIGALTGAKAAPVKSRYAHLPQFGGGGAQ